MAYGNKRGKVGQEKGAIDKNFVFGLEPGVTRPLKSVATYSATNLRFVNVVVLTLAYMGCDAWVVFVERRLGTNYVGMGGSKIEGGGGWEIPWKGVSLARMRCLGCWDTLTRPWVAGPWSQEYSLP